MKFLKIILVIISVVMITACGPRLQQVKNYIPPVTELGLECLSEADVSNNLCHANNQSRFDVCYLEAEQRAFAILTTKEKEYTNALEEYIVAERFYELAYVDYEEQQRLVRRDGELAYVRCSGDVNLTRFNELPQCKKLIDEANRKARRLPAPAKPMQPIRPTYSTILAVLERECNSLKEDCAALYDQAYLACGGQIDVQTICVSNCN